MGDAYAPFATADAATSLDLDDLEKARSRLSIWNAFARMWGGDPEGAQPAFAESVTVGQRFNDIDLLTMSRLAQGMCVIMRGHGPARIALLDELMVGVTSGEVSPMYAGIAYCTVIAGCSDLFDLRRAREWTAAAAAGAVLLAEGDARSALPRLRVAGSAWRGLDAPYETARVRVLIGLACGELGDPEISAIPISRGRS
jgi:hypothetical protein